MAASLTERLYLKRWLPLSALGIIFFCFFYFNFHRYFTFDSLRQNRNLLMAWKDNNYSLTLFLYFIAYITAAAASLPCNMFFFLVSGFLFGFFPGTFYALLTSTLGATLSYLAIRLAFADWLQQKAGKWLPQLEKGFKANAFFYLLTLRLIPLFPVSIINIVAGISGIRLSIFICSKFLGAIPSVLIYASLGHDLDTIFQTAQTPDLNLILQPRILIPLLGLAFLSILPIIYKHLKGRSKCLNPPPP